MNDCKYLHGKWCHNPEICELVGHQLCPFFNMKKNENDYHCFWYKKKG